MTQVDVAGPAAEALARISAADPARSFVVAQLGQSLDGRIATPSGESLYINGEEGLDHLHRLRAGVDPVLVGAGTVEADNPQLTVRRVPGRSPARILVSAAPRPLTGAENLVLPARDGRIAPSDIVIALAERGYRRLLVEGGARTISAFIDAGAIDRLHLIVGCMIIGSGKAGLDLHPLERLADAMRPMTEVYRLGRRDILFDCALRGGNGD